MHSPAITRSLCTRRTQRKHLSSPPSPPHHGLFCYNVMPFRLKNAGATYQRLVTKMFRPLFGKTMDVYIIVWKCVFGVSAGWFLGFMMTQRGMEASLSQLRAILESLAPSFRKEVQQLTGRLAALGRFISRFTDRSKPFFTTLRGVNRTGWNEECDRAFTQIKQYLVELPILASPDTGKTLFVYLAVSITAVSATMFKENEDGKQRHVFFVSKSLADGEIRYFHLEQAALALRIAAKKFRP